MEKSQFPETSNKFSNKSKNGSLEKQVSFFRIFCPRREDPRLVILLKSGKLDPWKKRVHFFRLFCPWREYPRLAILLNPESKKVNPDTTGP